MIDDNEWTGQEWDDFGKLGIFLFIIGLICALFFFGSTALIIWRLL